MQPLPAARLKVVVDRPPRADGDYVLYWMISYRRTHHNFSLDHALAWARKLNRPLLVFEPLRCGYRWASDRLHRFALQGMQDNGKDFAAHDIAYYPYVEAHKDADKGLLAALAARACVVVSDDYPCFFVPRMLHSVEQHLQTRLELCDSNGLLPMRVADKAFPTAYSFRRYLQKELPNHLLHRPHAHPLQRSKDVTGGRIPAAILKKWPAAGAPMLQATPAALGKLPIDHSVGPAAFAGGAAAGSRQAKAFVRDKLKHYAESRSDPDADVASGVSPYLHWGHLSVHEIFAHLVAQEQWEITALAEHTKGSREGWWGMSAPAEAFLDEVITWREIGFNMCVQRPDDYHTYESLPEWAQKTLREHAHDPREELYTPAQLEAAETDDPIWNAAQLQIVREGKLQNYMRMLWGKKFIQWSKTPQQALATMIHLNNKYGVDGRDPNSYSGMMWVFGRYDRPWPERPVFGKIRYMTSASTVRKLKMKKYLATFGHKKE